jgi:hypothetical protein
MIEKSGAKRGIAAISGVDQPWINPDQPDQPDLAKNRLFIIYLREIYPHIWVYIKWINRISGIQNLFIERVYLRIFRS